MLDLFSNRTSSGMSDAADREYEYRKQRYDSYVKERDGLRDASLQISERYDKWMLFLSGGALALSLTFIEKIAPHPQPWSFAILLVAWILLIVSVVLELHALATSQRALTEQVTLLDKEYQDFLSSLSSPSPAISVASIGAPAAAENEFAAKTRTLNAWSLRAFIAGIVFLCIFSAVNLPYGREQNDMANAMRERLSKGSFVPPRNVLPPPPPPQSPPPPVSVPTAPASPPQR
jgi:hypothetical protein